MKTDRTFVEPGVTGGENGRSSSSAPPCNKGFSLLEVMVAAAIFFTTIFAVLALVTSNIRNARHLMQPKVDAGLLLADYVQTNILTEGSDSGDFGDLYKGYQWSSETRNVGTNGLWQVDYIVTGGDGGKTKSVTTLSAFLYRPQSPAGTSFTK
jgi:Tfp pilus assembly protein PilV